MALSTAQLNFTRSTQGIARQLLDMRGKIAELQVLYSGAADFDTGIDQTDLTANFPESGASEAAFDDGLYAMGLIKTAIDNAEAAFVILANLP